MSPSLNVIVKAPGSCSEVELQDFIAMVLVGGEVDTEDLESRVRKAKYLVFLFEDGCLLGIAALKNPSPEYRWSVSEKAKIDLDPTAFPYELEYVFILPSARNRRLSRLLVCTALSHDWDAGVWATTRTDNHAMCSTLLRFGFSQLGEVYKSDRGTHQLQLYTREADQPSASEVAPKAERP